MKITLVNVVMFGGGVVLLYSGVYGFDPRDVIKWAMGGKQPIKKYGVVKQLVDTREDPATDIKPAGDGGTGAPEQPPKNDNGGPPIVSV